MYQTQTVRFRVTGRFSRTVIRSLWRDSASVCTCVLSGLFIWAGAERKDTVNSQKALGPLRSHGPALALSYLQGQHSTAALPFPWSADETASRPCGCGRKRDSARTRRIRGGVVVLIASAFHRASNAVPGGLKARGAVAWPETGPIRATEERGYPAQPVTSAPRAFKVFGLAAQF